MYGDAIRNKIEERYHGVAKAKREEILKKNRIINEHNYFLDKVFLLLFFLL